MVLVLHFFSSFFVTVDELKKCLVAEEDDRSHLLLRLYWEKKVLIIVVVLGWCVYRITLICFRSLSLISPLRGTCIAWFLPREGYILRYFHKGVILLDSFYRRDTSFRYFHEGSYIAWFLLQEEVLFLVFREKIHCLVPSTRRGGATAISYFYWRGLYCLLTSTRRSSQLPADLSEAEWCLGLVILSAGSLSCPLSLSKLPIFQCATATHNRLSDTSYTIKGLQLLGTLALLILCY